MATLARSPSPPDARTRDDGAVGETEHFDRVLAVLDLGHHVG